MARPSSYVKAFYDFVKDIRITSKEMVNEDGRGAPLQLWASQRRALEFIGRGLDDDIRTFYILKSRQLGITTVTLAIDLYWAALNPGLRGAIVTENENNREKNRAGLSQYLNSFPEGYFGDDFYIVKNNRQVVEFSNGAKFDLKVAGTKAKSSTAWAEGEGYTYCHLTEVASYGDEDGLESLEEAFAQQHPARLFIYESTAKGTTGPWRQRYMDGLQDGLTKRSTFIGWWAGDTNRIEKKDPRFSIYGGYPSSGEERDLVKAVKTLYDWTVTPEQLAWIRWKDANPSSNSDMLAQNQPWTADMAFVETGHSFFQSRMIGNHLKNIADHEDDFGYMAYRYDLGSSFFDIKLHAIQSSDESHLIELKVWEEPVDGAEYVIGVDPAWGRTDHKDKHAIQVMRCYADKVVQVAEYATADVEVKHCAWVLAHLAGAYKDCIVNIELNGPGRVIMPEWDNVRALLQSEYLVDRRPHSDWEAALDNARWYLYHRPDTMGSGYAYNTEASWKQQQVMMHGLRGEFVTNNLLIRSVALLKEMLAVRVQNGSIGAPESRSEDCKDDRVFALAYAVQAWIDWKRGPLMSQGLTYQSVTEREQGNQTPDVTRIQGIVFNFFRRAEEVIEIDERPKYLVDRGLL